MNDKFLALRKLSVEDLTHKIIDAYAVKYGIPKDNAKTLTQVSLAFIVESIERNGDLSFALGEADEETRVMLRFILEEDK